MAVLINCQSVSKSYPGKPLFTDVNFGIGEGERLGIVGPNGAGKSTLLKIIAGQEQPDDGQIAMRRMTKVAYVEQQDSFDPKKSAREALEAFIKGSDIVVADPDTAINRALGRVGLDNPDVLVGTLSGGWRKRMAIAGGMALEPDVLLLDEPTNHLDIEGVMWLEKLLKAAPFAWALISHDRQFLENVVKKVAELDKTYENNIFVSDGSYGDFLEHRDAYQQQQSSYAQSLANKVRREVEWLRRGPKARSTKAQARIDQAHSMQSELSQVKDRLKTGQASIDFTASGRKTKRLVVAEGLSASRGDKQLITNLDLVLAPGSRVGLLGANGSGKSTLISLLLKKLEPDSGTVTHADGLKWVYFEQARSTLDPTIPLRQALCNDGDAVVYRDKQVHVVSWAKKFLFRPEQLDVPTGELSGGEQARVLIAQLMLQNADVLFLDEPTNDLDIPTLEVLEESLDEFPGAIVLVSHDRYLLSQICTHYVGLDGNGTSQNFATLEQWQESLKQKKGGQKSKTSASTSGGSRTKKLGYMEQREFDGMEKAILKAEATLEESQAMAADPAIATQPAKLMEAAAALDKAQKEVDRLYARWEELEAKTK